PERRGSVATAGVPEADLELVRGVLDAEARPPGTGPGLSLVSGVASSIRVASREEIDRLWEGRSLREDDYLAHVELREKPRGFVADEVRTLDVSVSNLGGAGWSWGERQPEIRLTSRWWRGDAV